MTRTRVLARLVPTVILSLSSILAAMSPAVADVEIEYDLSRSRITAFAGLVEFTPTPPGSNGVDAPMARITLAGDVDDPQDGPALLEGFELADLPIDENLFDV